MLKEKLAEFMTKYSISVLILILMEHAQRDYGNFTVGTVNEGLNPYFNGTCSKSASDKSH